MNFYVCPQMQALRNALRNLAIAWSDQSENRENAWKCRTDYRYKNRKWSVIHGRGTSGEKSGRLTLITESGQYSDLTAAEVLMCMRNA